MTTATKFTPSKVPGAAPLAVIDLDAHNADLARRQAERDAKRLELLRCCNPVHAAQREYSKPMYQFTVKAQWYGTDHEEGVLTDFNSEQTVVAQNEADAWSLLCDRMGQYPSRRDTNVTFKRGKQLDPMQVAATAAANNTGDGGELIPKKTIGPKPKKKGRM